VRVLLRCLLALLIALPAATPPAQADDANTIHVVAVAIDLYAGAYYAQDQGFFKAAGLDVDVTTLANGGAAATALAGGSADIAVTNLIQTATAVAHGVPLTVIAGAGL
jgi:ABC-type nitrate/sulfonate/bicarbonate transport system substrate-binding protein